MDDVVAVVRADLARAQASARDWDELAQALAHLQAFIDGRLDAVAARWHAGVFRGGAAERGRMALDARRAELSHAVDDLAAEVSVAEARAAAALAEAERLLRLLAGLVTVHDVR